MTKELEQFIEATNACTGIIQEMIPMEKEKRQALLSEDPERMQEMMQTQQAAMMRLRLAEEKRIQYQKDAGFGHLRAEEILEQAPPEQKESLQACFLDLRRAAEQLQAYNAKAMEIAQANLAFWESTMHKEHLSAPQQVTYSAKKGSAPSTFGGSSFQTKV